MGGCGSGRTGWAVARQLARDGRVLVGEDDIALAGVGALGAAGQGALAARLDEEVHDHTDADEQPGDDSRTLGRVVVAEGKHGGTVPSPQQAKCELLLARRRGP